ncbi:MAG: V-type ATP synthase subunit A, partial [Candidatus Omnitrophota bacterium]
MPEIRGEIVEVNGPVIKACGFSSAGIGDQVEVGPQKLIGEIIAIEQDIAIIQVYEDTTGLRLGMEVISLGHPISVELGPGLIGNVFDGLQRPLSKIAEVSPFIQRGAEKQALDRERI